MQDEERRKELAAFLRAKRASLRPADVGLPEGHSVRRAPGLRREEVATLSGIGVSWYTWLEQARDVWPSYQVVDAIARTLRLTPDEHVYLRNLAIVPQSVEESTLDVTPSMQRMIDSLAPNPVYVVDDRFDFLAWNESFSTLWRDPATMEPSQRNLVWQFFTDHELPHMLENWEERAFAFAMQLRSLMAASEDKQRFDELVDALSSESTAFAGMWQAHEVANFSAAQHRFVIGDRRLVMDITQLQFVESPRLRAIALTPATDEDRTLLIGMLSA